MTIEHELLIDNADTLESTKKKEECFAVRLDKWLWATRFFKTRALARLAIENGEVQYNGIFVKPSREIQIGDVVTVRQRGITKAIIIKGLSTRRRSIEETASLLEETFLNIENQNPRHQWHPHSSSEQNQSSPRTVRFLRRGVGKFSQKKLHFSPF